MKLWKLRKAWLVVATLGLVACGPQSGQDAAPSNTSTTSATATSGATTQASVVVTDSASIWCDENRWQVIIRAEQLEFDTPPTNPSEDEVLADLKERGNDIIHDMNLGRISATGAVAAQQALIEESQANSERYESGEWSVTGVRDDDSSAWQADNPTSYARACVAAYDLAE